MRFRFSITVVAVLLLGCGRSESPSLAVLPPTTASFFACRIGEPLVIVTAGKTYLVNPSEKPVPIGILEFTGRDTNGEFIFTKPLKFTKPCPGRSTGDMENDLATLEGVESLWVKLDEVKQEKMERYEMTEEEFGTLLKAGDL